MKIRPEIQELLDKIVQIFQTNIDPLCKMIFAIMDVKLDFSCYNCIKCPFLSKSNQKQTIIEWNKDYLQKAYILTHCAKATFTNIAIEWDCLCATFVTYPSIGKSD